MEKNNILITISGASGTGKSTLSKVIYDALTSHGLLVFMDLENYNVEPYINAVREKSTIQIKEVTTKREPLRNYDESIPKYSEILTLDQWYQAKKDDMLTRYDGTGYWAKDGKMSYDTVYSYPALDATHVIWFNS